MDLNSSYLFFFSRIWLKYSSTWLSERVIVVVVEKREKERGNEKSEIEKEGFVVQS